MWLSQQLERHRDRSSRTQDRPYPPDPSPWWASLWEHQHCLDTSTSSWEHCPPRAWKTCWAAQWSCSPGLFKFCKLFELAVKHLLKYYFLHNLVEARNLQSSSYTSQRVVNFGCLKYVNNLIAYKYKWVTFSSPSGSRPVHHPLVVFHWSAASAQSSSSRGVQNLSPWLVSLSPEEFFIVMRVFKNNSYLEFNLHVTCKYKVQIHDYLLSREEIIGTLDWKIFPYLLVFSS